jgi:hypothetical protein
VALVKNRCVSFFFLLNTHEIDDVLFSLWTTHNRRRFIFSEQNFETSGNSFEIHATHDINTDKDLSRNKTNFIIDTDMSLHILLLHTFKNASG